MSVWLLVDCPYRREPSVSWGALSNRCCCRLVGWDDMGGHRINDQVLQIDSPSCDEQGHQPARSDRTALT